jgi:MinD-like ATPase involved in chromosome partitioning or flagellar assembly
MAKIVSVHSFRGGTGKSNLTANLAATAAAQGLRVGIVDTDIQSPGIHVIFGLEEKQINRALNDYLWGNCAIEDTAYSLALPQLAGKGGAVYLIPSSIKAGEIARVLREGYDVGLLNDGFQALIDRLRLDVLFIDTHPGLNEETLLSLAISDVLVLILRPDRQDFQGTAVTVEVARKLQVPQLLLVVNKALPSMDFPSLRQRVADTYNATVAGVFPECEEMLELASSGVFCLHYPDHPFTREVQRVARLVLGDLTGGRSP